LKLKQDHEETKESSYFLKSKIIRIECKNKIKDAIKARLLSSEAEICSNIGEGNPINTQKRLEIVRLVEN
jgi:hypothetical protein